MQPVKIVRMWHGAVPKDKADEYYQYLQQTGLKDYAGTPGNQGVSVLRRDEAEVTHFLLITFWDSVSSIKAFAGEEYEKARYYPDDEQFLLDLEPAVIHYQLIYQQ
jgi:heme-degrading monooxygenase HmoA